MIHETSLLFEFIGFCYIISVISFEGIENFLGILDSPSELSFLLFIIEGLAECKELFLSFLILENDFLGVCSQ
jgi:hypothetical protein